MIFHTHLIQLAIDFHTLQNARLDHGQGRLIKDLSHTKPDLSSIKAVLDRLVSLATTTSSEIQPVVILEFFPLKKIQSIPNGTCAFQRPKFNNGILVMTWKNNTLENLKLARSIAREFASMVAIGQQKYHVQVEQGYGNYGTLVFLVQILMAGVIAADMRKLDHTQEEDGVGDVKNKAEALFRENYPRLQELKKKYDPENIFNKWFAITPSP